MKADESGKSKSDLKAERRQKQEAQRAAKVAPVTDAKQLVAPKVQQGKRIPDQIQADRPTVERRLVKRCVSQKVCHILNQKLGYCFLIVPLQILGSTTTSS